MVDTHQRIIDAAKALFNERGFDSVSLREIAEACSISVGNLNYHFKKKETLVMAIQQGITDELLERLQAPPFHDIRDLLEIFERVRLNQQANAYYFRNMLEFGRAYEGIRQHQLKQRETLYRYYCKTLYDLRDTGVLRSDLAIAQYNTLAFAFVFQHTLWHENGSPASDPLFYGFAFEEHLQQLLYPYLSGKGIKQFAAYFQK